MMPSPVHRIFVLLVILLPIASVAGGCGRPNSGAGDDSAAVDQQKLPFDRQPHANGISPSRLLIPVATKLPEGTPIPIRLQSALSSASSRAGEMFHATIDEPVVIDGQTLIARGTPATGRVLEAKASASSVGNSSEPGYLRIVLVSVNVGDRPVMVETSSIFAKGGSREERNVPNAVGVSAGEVEKDKNRDLNIVFGVDRRLSFRLAQTVDLQ